jgi:hypothetical protein
MARKLHTYALAALLAVAIFLIGQATAQADTRTDGCNPLTYGRPNSCHTAPVVTDRADRLHAFMATYHTVSPIITRSATSATIAGPAFGSRWTYRHGWIVWADNDRPYTIHTRCRWYAGGNYWHTSWWIRPYHKVWTTSDAGSWGNSRPRNLRCSYT